MLKSLLVQNYALIDHLEIDFGSGLSIISGETGAGKSILLGALSIILGQRADTSVLFDKSGKCIVEGVFDIGGYDLEEIFSVNELDLEQTAILRREINPAGKSRAFVNDTPVALTVLKEIGIKLVDIHSQHENLMLGNHQFQLRVVDTFAGNKELLEQYGTLYRQYRDLQQTFAELRAEVEKNQSDLDYYQFQYEQLEKASLIPGEQQELESELQTLLHAGEIRGNLLQSSDILSGDDQPVLARLREVQQLLQKIAGYHAPAEEMAGRLGSVLIELKDLSEEAERLGNIVEYDPQRLGFVQQRLDLIYTLLQKHHAPDITRLVDLFRELGEKIETISSYDTNLEKISKDLLRRENELGILASGLTEKRKAVRGKLEETMTGLLQQLGMPHARFSIDYLDTGEFTPTGTCQVAFLFSANRKTQAMDISRVASGGELSRLMLCLKSVLTRSLDLPTIIFDEIDAGVSGEIADKVGRIILDMSANMQVINITHLPQIASKGQRHYLVYKTDEEELTHTRIRLLSMQERIHEIARMLSGEELTDAAFENARALLKN